MDRDEILWAITFLTRVTTRGHQEEEALVRLVEKLSLALNHSCGTRLAGTALTVR